MSKRATPKDIAEQTRLHPNTVRHWADKGLIECAKDFQGRRWFPNEVETVRQVNELLGLTPSGDGVSG